MIIERDVPIPMDDGIVLRADIFRPDDSKPAPVIMTLGPYGKGVPYRDGFKPQWDWLLAAHPEAFPDSSKEYMVWETVDPETWVPGGYVVIRVDSRGAGRSQGKLDIFSPRETRDYYHAIEWAAVQQWSTGKVGLCGISYYAINQWLVASLQPPHLSAMVPWEGAADFYRDQARHGGSQSNGFMEVWYPRQIIRVQYGNAGENTITDPWLSDLASGPERLSAAELLQNRTDPVADILNRPLDDHWYRERSPDWSKVTVPFLSAANWAGFGLHPRGNFEAFTNAASTQKWLECHPGRHEERFYLESGIRFEKPFLDHFLKGEDNGWDKQPPVHMHIRRPSSDEFEYRTAQAWPLPDTKWSKLYLDVQDQDEALLTWNQPTASGELSFDALSQGVTFMSAPLQEETEITGPIAAQINASSSTSDVDLFLTFQAFAPDGREVDFQGTIDPHTPLAQGWLRASQRKLDPEKSLPYRPYLSHDGHQPLVPGEFYQLDVEIWPTNIVLPKGFRLALRVAGMDFERSADADSNEAWHSRGSGPWLHNLPADRPEEVFGGRTSLRTGSGGASSYILLPIIPST